MNRNGATSRVVGSYLAHLMGRALSGRESESLPDRLSGESVVSCARDNGALWLDGVPDDVRAPCKRFSDMVALHNVRYEAERVAVCAALRFAPRA
ncbi:hypothetical protein H6A23_05995 [Olsenella uli]|uniref:hypothetical protein n=1 Tax=Olsenella uli TaxID=133926 RepID=UPI001957A452|nr:hypothetical protein [Olsenella uli]MBM6816717.1 hypothetical protein [Olsenella uli]